MTVQRWEQTALTADHARDIVDGWAAQVAAVSQLAAIIAGTEFVPKGFRGSDTAVTAAILAGRELGIGPMTALQHFYVVNGRVGMSAQLMRALVFAHGHTIRVVDLNNERCALVGRRKGDTTDSPAVPWTIADARRAGLLTRDPWRNYPRAMLLARATGELCRALFPDVIGGMAYTSEELDDMPAETTNNNTPAPTHTVRRTQGKPPAVAPSPAGEGPRPAPSPAGDPPPLPGDDEPETPPPVMSTPENPYGATEPAKDTEPVQASRDQQKHVWALLGEADKTVPRDERLRVLSGLTRRRITTSNQLTREDASHVIDSLTLAKQSGDPAALEALVAAGWEAIAEREQPALWEDTLGDDEGNQP